MSCSPEKIDQIKEEILAKLQEEMDLAIGEKFMSKPEMSAEVPAGEPEVGKGGLPVEDVAPVAEALADEGEEEDEYPGSRVMERIRAGRKNKMMG